MRFAVRARELHVLEMRLQGEGGSGICGLMFGLPLCGMMPFTLTNFGCASLKSFADNKFIFPLGILIRERARRLLHVMRTLTDKNCTE